MSARQKKPGDRLPPLGSQVAAAWRRARRLWNELGTSERRGLGVSAVLNLLNAMVGTEVSVLLGRLVNAFSASAVADPTAWPHPAAYFFIAFTITLLVRESLFVFRKYLVRRACASAEGSWTVGVAERLLRADLRKFSGERTGAIQGRVSRSIAGAVQFLRVALEDFLSAACMVACAITCALWQQPAVGMLMTALTPVALVIVLRQLAVQKGIRVRALRGREALDGALVERFSAMEYVRAANTQEQELARVARLACAQEATETGYLRTASRFDGLKATYQWAFQVVLVGCAWLLVRRGMLGVGDVLLFWNLSYSVFLPLKDVNRILEDAHESGLCVDDLLSFLHEPADSSFGAERKRDASPPNVTPCAERSALVTMEDLILEYPTPEGTVRALDGVSLTIGSGETIGIAGRSGSGKSSLVKILLRLCAPTSGRVRLGGASIEHVSREAIGRWVGYVGQTPFVFAGTIAENIAYGCPGATRAAIREAAKRACIDDDILRMPGGYDAPVTERGQNLSGGQRQRLALARIFLKNPPILILDEATSALDTITERSVQRALAAARQGRTVILVAHRLSTLRQADRILVFDGGRIVESGTYHELLRRQGLLARLAGKLRRRRGKPLVRSQGEAVAAIN